MKTTQQTVHGALSLHRVLDPEYGALLQVLSHVSGSRDARKFPGSNPCSLERADFPKLHQQPYYLTEKTNGVRFLLFCCTLQSKKICALVDRAMGMYLLPLHALPTVLFEGSVIDCELAFNQVERQWQLLVFDAYVVSGIPLFHRPFSYRMGAFKRAMVVYEYTTSDPMPIKVKSFIPTSMISTYKQHEEEAKRFFDIDGIILTPELSHAAIGRHTELFKLKTHHTIDFLVGADGHELGVYDLPSKKHKVVARLRSAARPGAVVECASAADGLWDVVCERTDKATANDMLTFQKTLVNMQEGITFEELHGLFTHTA